MRKKEKKLRFWDMKKGSLGLGRYQPAFANRIKTVLIIDLAFLP